MSGAIVVQRPLARPAQLVLLFHGVGASARDLQSLGEALAPHLHDALVVSEQAPFPSDFGAGWQWFSVQGVTEENRPARVAAAMPRFIETISKWQAEAGLGPAATMLVGFSQGAIMSLAATQQATPPAHRIVSIAGRFARPPLLAPADTRVHLMHGDADRVVPHRFSIEAAAQLQALGADVTLDLFDGLGHGIDQRVLARILERCAP